MDNGNDGIHNRNIPAQKHVVGRLDHWNRSNGCWDIAIFRCFQDGGRPPSWICGMCIWATHEEYLVVFIIVQNLVEIDPVVLVICKFSYFTILPWKCLFTPPKWGFGGIWPPMGNGSDNVQKSISLHRNTSYDVKIVEIGQKVAEI